LIQTNAGTDYFFILETLPVGAHI